MMSKMWFSRAVLLLVMWFCVVDVALGDDKMKRSVPRVPPLRSRRMIGGVLAPHVPWQAMVYLSDKFLEGSYAGGALISERWILTSGRNLFAEKRRHEINGTSPLIPKVYLGITSRQEANESTEVAVDKVFLHPDFQNHSDWDNDVALIKLKHPVVISDKITPIPLPSSDHNLESGEGAFAGWGWGILFTSAEYLKQLILPLSRHASCKGEYQGNDRAPPVDDNMFCTKSYDFSQNVCFGDSGSVLAVKDDNTGDVYAAGILSYDKPCNQQKHAVYMKTYSYLPWIYKVLRGDVENSAAVRAEAMSEMLKRKL